MNFETEIVAKRQNTPGVDPDRQIIATCTRVPVTAITVTISVNCKTLMFIERNDVTMVYCI